MNCIWVVICLCISVSSVVEGDFPQIKISDGILNGAYLKTINNRKFSSFQGIPFAQPPIGELRFQEPIPNNPWEGEKNVTKVHTECIQRPNYLRIETISGEEDCLYLNVYTPKINHFERDPLPVMVWFHGGAFECGAGNSFFYGPEILLDQDVVLVATNYRLGPFGFLSTGDKIVPGNNGLKDQNLALKWVWKNIHNFGGDPNQITLSGQSVGGAISNFHMLSPLSQGLFKRVILQSGNALSPWALSENDETVKNTLKLAEALKCPIKNSQEMIECMRNINARDFMELYKIFMIWDYEPMMPFKPVVEPKDTKNAFLPDHPLNIIKSGKSMDVPIMLGLTTEDGAVKIAGYENLGLLDDFAEKFNTIIPLSLMYYRTEKDPAAVTEKLRNFYFAGRKIQDSIDNITNMYTDGLFLQSIDDVARLYTKYYKKPVYFYTFGYRGSSSFSKIVQGGEVNYGTCHSDELLYLFPLAKTLFPDVPPTDEDKNMSKILTTLWTNFVKFGNPTPTTNDIIPNKWNPYTLKNEEYFQIDSNHLETKNYPFKERTEFWRKLVNDPISENPREEL